MPVTMPSQPGFISSRFGLETNTRRIESPFTKNVQRSLLAGSRWTATFNLPPMNRQQYSAWQAFLLSLEGGVQTFNAYDPDARYPRGVATGTPLVKGASQTGSSLIIDGATASITGWLLPGDYFSVNGELKMVTSQVNTNGSGEATINFKPALRSSPADNAALTVSLCAVPMILVDDSQSMWDGNKHGIVSGLSFSAYEVFS